jgi:MFS family permease
VSPISFRVSNHFLPYNPRAVRFDFGFDALVSPPWLRRWGPLRRAKGSVMDRASLHYYTLSASLGAAMVGAFSLGMVVLKKSLGATEMQLGVISAIGPMALLLGIFGGELVRGRDRRPVIALFGIISRGAFLLFALVQSAWAYIGVASLFYIGNALQAPAVTTLWQNNISPARRSALWGLTISITTVISVTVAFAVGWLLDLDHMAYRWLFPIAGLLGLLSTYILVRMPHRGRYKTRKAAPLTARGIFIRPIRRFIKLLRDDPFFRHFEGAFFLYGCAFMLMAPVLPHYIVDLAQMSYKKASIAEGVLFQLGAIGLSVAWGKLMDRTSPSATCAVVFALLALFPAILLGGLALRHTGFDLQYIVYLGYLVFGIGMSGLGVAWNLAPISFAGSADASAYTGAHITLTGVRGAIAPIMGAIGFKYFGYELVFGGAMALFLIASISMGILERRMRARKAQAVDTEPQPTAEPTTAT